MNKTEIIDNIANDTGITRAHVGLVIDMCLNYIVYGMERDGFTTLANFGSFEKRTPILTRRFVDDSGEKKLTFKQRPVAFNVSPILKKTIYTFESKKIPKGACYNSGQRYNRHKDYEKHESALSKIESGEIEVYELKKP